MPKIKEKENAVEEIERRFITPPEIRVDGDDAGKKLIGYAAVFNSLSVELGYFREQIAPGAFTDTIKQDDIRALVDHDSSRILGRNTAKTLKLSEDTKGLLSEIDVPDTSIGQDVLVSVSRGDLSQMSFAFRVIAESWDYGEDEDDTPLRTLEKLQLYDVSVVTYPAYPDTEVGVRSMEAWLKNEKSAQNRSRAMKMRLRLAEII